MEISQLLGKTLTAINSGSDEVIFVTSEGDRFKMYHKQDCCEGVTVEDINGDLNDLLNSPITLAEESESNDIIDGKPQNPDSFTWTFYKIGNVKATVVIRWLGESNGYYSESVSFIKL